MTTEHEIKAVLDGWFFVYNCISQTVTRRKVAKDYIPTHKPRTLEPDAVPDTARKWKPSEDEFLIELRHRNLSWREVCKYIPVSPSCARGRYLELCRRRGITEFHYKRPLENCQYEDRVMAMREKGLSFGVIAERLGLTRNRVAGIVQRARRRANHMEMAA